MKKSLVLVGLLISLLNAFSLDSMIDSVSDRVSDAVGNKVSDSIENYGSESDKEHKVEEKKDKFAKLKELVEMRDAGYITKEEFQEAKKELLQ